MPHQDHGLRKKRLTAVVLFLDCDYWMVFDMMITTMRHPVRFISSAVLRRATTLASESWQSRTCPGRNPQSE